MLRRTPPFLRLYRSLLITATVQHNITNPHKMGDHECLELGRTRIKHPQRPEFKHLSNVWRGHSRDDGLRTKNRSSLTLIRTAVKGQRANKIIEVTLDRSYPLLGKIDQVSDLNHAVLARGQNSLFFYISQVSNKTQR